MKIGVIGTGYWGKKHVIEFKELGVPVIAVDLDEKKLEEVKGEGIITTTKKEDILQDPNVKGVTICSPNKHHVSLAKECLDAGKHVLVEKPLAETEEEAKELVKKAEEKGLVLMVGHIYRFNNAVDKAKELMEKGELGKIQSIKIHWINDEYAFQPDFDQRVGDRDVITDLAVHPYDILHYLLGKNPDYIFCTGGSYRLKGKLEAVTMLGKQGETMVEMGVSWVTPPKTRSLVIVGEKKSLFVSCAVQKIDVFANGETTPLEVEANNTIATELKYFLDLVEGKEKENKANGEVGAEIVRMLQLTENSVKNQKVLKT